MDPIGLFFGVVIVAAVAAAADVFFHFVLDFEWKIVKKCVIATT